MSAVGIREFLTAQYDEDEAIAKAADDGPWSFSVGVGRYSSGGIVAPQRHPGYGETVIADFDHSVSGANIDHMTRHDPERVLAEVAAKRRRLERHAPSGGLFCAACEQPWPCDDVLNDAAVYADQPGYAPEWKIEP